MSVNANFLTVRQRQVSQLLRNQSSQKGLHPATLDGTPELYCQREVQEHV